MCTVVPKTVIAEDQISPEVQKLQQEEIQHQEELRLRQLEEEKIKAYSIELTSKAEALVGTRQGQCVLAARRFLFGNDMLGRSQIHDYVQTTINSHDPVVGSFIVIVGRMRHTGVTLFSTPTEVYFYDSNFVKKNTAAIQHWDINDKRIKGYHVVE